MCNVIFHETDLDFSDGGTLVPPCHRPIFKFWSQTEDTLKCAHKFLRVYLS